jgi:perosamine synthetase
MKLCIPLARPEITDADRDAVLGVLQTSTLSSGPQVEKFEQALCKYLGARYAVAVNSGTSALHLAVETLGLPRGSEVILPSFAFAAPLNVLLQCGLRPVFVDIEAETLNTTPEKIEAAMTARTSAIIAIHTFGRPLDMSSIMTLARHNHLRVIEDACEAMGSEINGQKAGTFGDVGVLAFYPNKQITTGEGGVLLTSDAEIAKHARRLRNQGRDPALDWLQQVEVGYSYRLSDINSALGVSQLQRLEIGIARRLWLAALYDDKLKVIHEVRCPGLQSLGGRISWFCYVIQLREDFDRRDRDRLCEVLISHGIGCGRYFAPLHRQPILANENRTFDLPVTDFVADHVIALPFYNQMNEAEVDVVVTTLAESLAEMRRKA